jgi:hypothetical protein
MTDLRAQVLEKARHATNQLRDAAREGVRLDSFRRDPLVLAIHAAFDELEAALPAEGDSPAPSPLELGAAVETARRHGWNRDDITLAGWIAALRAQLTQAQAENARLREERAALYREFNETHANLVGVYNEIRALAAKWRRENQWGDRKRADELAALTGPPPETGEQ